MRILYLGNDLSRSSKYHSAYATLKSNLIKEGYTVYTASSKENQLLRLFDMLLHIVKYRNKIDYVLIDTFSTNAFYFSFLCAQLARCYQLKYIPILHGGNLPQRIENSVFLSNLIFKNSYKNVAPSNYLKKAFQKKGYPSILIPNSIAIDSYFYKERSVLAPKLLYVRAFANIYNPTMAIEVFKKLLETEPSAELCMVGPDRDGTLATVLEEIKQNNLEEKVKITGVLPKEEWHQLSVDYDIFINTTNVDNTPVSLIEAMALGMPIVSTNVGGIPYLMEDGSDGILVNPNSVTEMYDGIVSLLEDSSKANLFSKNGRAKATQLDWSFVSQEWKKVLGHVE